MKKIQIAILTLCLLLPVTIVPNDSNATLVLSKPEEFKEEFLTVPCKNEERLAAVKSLFLKMGAPEADITIEKIKDVENIVLRKAGETDEKIIVGAHYDVAGPGSCGAIDNWTGIVAIAHLYKTLKDAKLKKTILFVGFDKEEKGLLGSKAMTKQIKKEEVNQYCAMINIDSLGLNTPQVLKNITSQKLVVAAEDLAKKMKLEFQSFDMGNASSDSASFLEKKIPAITFSAITNDWQAILHHKSDQADRVNPISVYLGYRLALALVTQINDNECGTYR